MFLDEIVLVFLAGCLPVYICIPPQYVYQTKYMSMPVDHFSFSMNNESFHLRYLINETYWKPDTGAPIFFYTGNEGDIKMFAENTGFIWEIAPEFDALVVFAEHRYYGESMPFGNKSFSDPKYLGYLTTSQALADFVDVIAEIKSQYKIKKQHSPVIAFGGSYGGMLAAWIRMKYPASVAGAIAASAPIWQFSGMTPCQAFYRVTTSVYHVTSHMCTKCIRNVWPAINRLGATDAGKAWLTKNWKLCKPLKTADDVKDLKNWMSEVYVDLAMVNYPYPTSFLQPLPAHPIMEFCKFLHNSTEKDEALLEKMFKSFNIYFNLTGTSKCLNVKQDATPDLGEKGWNFQACTEMVMPMCSDGDNDMFEPAKWDSKQFSDDCFNKYKVRPQMDLAEKLYGGKDIHTSSNIIFSNGLWDPWASGGVLYNVSQTAVAVVMEKAAHHLDLRASNTADPYSVTTARKFYRKTVRSWIKDRA